jgi:DNA-binding transcriptional ArsR family regulator
MTQLSMLYRLTGRDTAVEAGESVRAALPQMQAEVLATLARWHVGATAYEIMCELNRNGRGRQQSSVARRLTDLERAGLVADTGTTRSGSSNRLLIVWAVAEAGREAVR